MARFVIILIYTFDQIGQTVTYKGILIILDITYLNAMYDKSVWLV